MILKNLKCLSAWADFFLAISQCLFLEWHLWRCLTSIRTHILLQGGINWRWSSSPSMHRWEWWVEKKRERTHLLSYYMPVNPKGFAVFSYFTRRTRLWLKNDARYILRIKEVSNRSFRYQCLELFSNFQCPKRIRNGDELVFDLIFKKQPIYSLLLVYKSTIACEHADTREDKTCNLTGGYRSIPIQCLQRTLTNSSDISQQLF